jgi:hypothetical protein
MEERHKSNAEKKKSLTERDKQRKNRGENESAKVEYHCSIQLSISLYKIWRR